MAGELILPSSCLHGPVIVRFNRYKVNSLNLDVKAIFRRSRPQFVGFLSNSSTYATQLGSVDDRRTARWTIECGLPALRLGLTICSAIRGMLFALPDVKGP